ncbi:oligosaccharide flippase family protein [Verrucomicrobia bacterium]|nr:oligosaccharide flippase family protein [Verrucomicrobiota bacterium]MDA7657487.1 oligosaccharide flippase family protein [Verrucomicrobiota bacterium]
MEGFLNRLGWQSVSSISTLVLGLSYTLVLARGLGVEEFGRFSLGLGFVTLVFLLFDARLTEVVIKFALEAYEHKQFNYCSSIVKHALILNSLLGCAALITSLILIPFAPSALFNVPGGSRLILLLAVGLLFIGMWNGTTLGIVRLLGLFKEQAFYISAILFSKLVFVGVGIFIFKLESEEVAAMIIVINAVGQGAFLRFCLKKLDSKLPKSPLNSDFRILRQRISEMTGFMKNNYFSGLTSIPLKEGDIYILGWYTGLYEIGIYRTAKYFMNAIWALSDPLLYVIFPEFVQLRARRQFELMEQLRIRMMKWLSLTALVIFSSTLFSVPWILSYGAGSGYSDSGRVFSMMIWGILFWMPLMWCSPLLLSSNRSDLVLLAGILNSTVTIGSGVVLVRSHGALGVAFAGALGASISAIAAYLFVKRLQNR